MALYFLYLYAIEPASDRFYMCLSMLESRRWHTLAKQSGKIFLKIFQKHVDVFKTQVYTVNR